MATSLPVVSILTPTFNHEEYIAECIQSVLTQTFREWEMIVLDDGSHDRTREIVLRYSRVHSRILLLEEQHRGPEGLCRLYNRGLGIARGEFIAILEGDDYWPADKLSLQVRAFEERAGVSYGRCSVVDPRGKSLFTLIPSRKRDIEVINNQPLGNALSSLVHQDNFIPAVTAMIRRDVLVQIGGFSAGPGMMQVDFSTWCRLSLFCEFQYIEANLGFWRRHTNSVSTKNVRRIAESKNEFLQSFFGEVNETHPTIATRFNDKISRALAANLGEYKLIMIEALHRLNSREFSRAAHLFKKSMMLAQSVTQITKSIAGLLLSLTRVPIGWLRR